ncbi:MAG: STAS/SEC14 domain-containing protein [Desulfobaccales bacterium]
MLEIMPESEGPLLWLRARERLTVEDYREVFIPRLGLAIREHGQVRLLLHLGPDFRGWTPGAWWENLKLELKHRGDFKKLGQAGASYGADALLRLLARFMPGEVRTFFREHLAEAWIWIQE